MIKEIPEKLIEFYPPHYDLDGSEVMEMIKYIPEKINLPIIRKPNPSEAMYPEKYLEREVPPLEKEAIEVLYYAVQEMFKIFKSMKKNYSISEYNVGLSLHTDYDIVEVSFCFKIESWLDGQGGGPGVSFYFTLSSHALLKTTHMR